ncbi:MAG: His/Gly/Thr/Pro-type tRNA ligase C-terminal domain-containing protein, partial [Clostridia bacterium]|nr:His/Gly/Thr/Pro-type tRNA ligase C-terminal domain-containing protein [Clostridia bacterium]
DHAVTVRDRDTMTQERIKIEDLSKFFKEKFKINMEMPVINLDEE